MKIEEVLAQGVADAVKALYDVEITPESVNLQPTRKEFEGNLTVVVFPYLKASHKSPEATANEIGAWMKDNVQAVSGYNAVKGFLNMTVSSNSRLEELKAIEANPEYGIRHADENSDLVMVEYSSPNTNKPLHLGHVRNNLLGYSLSCILEANGHKVVKTNIVNDRGIHICKSMLAWKKWGNGATPESTGKKGDHLIGDFYVLFAKKLKEETEEIMKRDNIEKDEAEAKTTLMAEAREMLRLWEAGDPEVRAL